MVWGGSAVAVATIVGWVATAVPDDPLLADSICLLEGHFRKRRFYRPPNQGDTARFRRPCLRANDFTTFLAGSALVCGHVVPLCALKLSHTIFIDFMSP